MLAAALGLWLGMAPAHAQLSYPDTPRREVIDVYHGRSVSDPYRWLEDANADEVRAWVDRQNEFTRELLRQVRTLPGVDYASLTTQLPFSGNNSSSVITPEGYVPQAGESLLSPRQSWVGTDYFETLGIPLLQGRTFDFRDDAGDQQVIIIDEWLANRK